MTDPTFGLEAVELGVGYIPPCVGFDVALIEDERERAFTAITYAALRTTSSGSTVPI